MKEVLTISIFSNIFNKMKRSNKLRSVIKQALREVCESVYYQKADSKAVYPYLTFYLKHTKQEHQYLYFLEVHVWMRDDYQKAEELADYVEEMDGCAYCDDDISFDIDLESRNNIEDEDKEIQHIVLLFNLNYFDKRG